MISPSLQGSMNMFPRYTWSHQCIVLTMTENQWRWYQSVPILLLCQVSAIVSEDHSLWVIEFKGIHT